MPAVDEDAVDEDAVRSRLTARVTAAQARKQAKSFLDKQMEELYKLDYEDIVGGQLMRFEYTKVPQADFGISTEDILNLPDKVCLHCHGGCRGGEQEEEEEQGRVRDREREKKEEEEGLLQAHCPLLLLGVFVRPLGFHSNQHTHARMDNRN
jgi:hypothetical protein